jgi:hypothetical protein
MNILREGKNRKEQCGGGERPVVFELIYRTLEERRSEKEKGESERRVLSMR